ncbi:MAG: helix-hairpin-helix domain-containing protein [Clostridia bacterium]|jgi:competence protein ComEA|nr:helix-hairpin-helix domain-containing protein [Clostridia bacterium]
MFTEKPDRKQIIALAVLLGVILFFGGVKYYELRLDKIEIQTGIIPVEEGGIVQAAEPAEADPPLLSVHVVGAVEKPGVYTLEGGLRVDDAVKLAVPAEKADLSQINLAVLLEDGKQIYVPAKGEAPALPENLNRIGAPKSNGVVNINTASSAELETLSGIGPALAGRIIDYRTANGAFAEVDDLTKVSGIGPAVLNKIRSKITVR